MDAATGILTVVAGNGTVTYSGDGGPATQAGIGFPWCVAVDTSGNLYITDGALNYIRKVDAATGVISTIAGNGQPVSFGDGGPAASAGLDVPVGISVDANGNLYIAEAARIRRIDGVTGIITTVAGNGVDGFSGDGGPATVANLNYPTFAAADSSGNLYISDTSNRRLRRVSAATGIISTVAGSGAPAFNGDGIPAVSANIDVGFGIADALGNIFLADRENLRVRRGGCCYRDRYDRGWKRNRGLRGRWRYRHDGQSQFAVGPRAFALRQSDGCGADWGPGAARVSTGGTDVHGGFCQFEQPELGVRGKHYVDGNRVASGWTGVCWRDGQLSRHVDPSGVARGFAGISSAVERNSGTHIEHALARRSRYSGTILGRLGLLWKRVGRRLL